MFFTIFGIGFLENGFEVQRYGMERAGDCFKSYGEMVSGFRQFG